MWTVAAYRQTQLKSLTPNFEVLKFTDRITFLTGGRHVGFWPLRGCHLQWLKVILLSDVPIASVRYLRRISRSPPAAKNAHAKSLSDELHWSPV